MRLLASPLLALTFGLCLTAASLTGCSSDSDDAADSGSTTGDDSGGSGSDTASSGKVQCGDMEADVFAVGLSRATDGGTWMVTMMASTPSPPDQGFNEFEVKVTDASGAEMTGLTVTIEPRMPQHGHGTVPATFVGKDMGAGMYSLPENPDDQGIDFIMPGAWTVHFHIEDSAGTQETASFVFCLEG